MRAAKKQKASSSVPTWLRRFFSWLLGAGRPVLMLAILLGALGGGSYFAWQKLKMRILDSPEYFVGPGQVEITRPPAWIHTDIRAEAFRDPRLDGRLSIMDDDLINRIKRVFEDHPWVARVKHVKKGHPASINVKLEYRRPVCMVEAPGGAYAVDAKGYILPSEDFTSSEATRYLHLMGVDRAPTSPVGQLWSDAKVIGGAEIAAVLGPVWQSMKLKYIVPLASDPAAGAVTVGGDSSRRSREPFFILLTHGDRQILWGYAPGANMLGEISAEEKVAWLKNYLSEHDTFDDPRDQHQYLDVRTMGKRGG